MSRHPLAEDGPVPGQAQLMERVVERSNMQMAYRRVKQNKGAPGVDGMGVDQLGDFLRAHWPRIKERLCEGSYEPKPVRRAQIAMARGAKCRRLHENASKYSSPQPSHLTRANPKYKPPKSLRGIGSPSRRPNSAG